MQQTPTVTARIKTNNNWPDPEGEELRAKTAGNIRANETNMCFSAKNANTRHTTTRPGIGPARPVATRAPLPSGRPKDVPLQQDTAGVNRNSTVQKKTFQLLSTRAMTIPVHRTCPSQPSGRLRLQIGHGTKAPLVKWSDEF